MKPDPDVSGVPFNFDAIPMWLYPDVWDETKRVRLRGLWFVLLYTLSFLVFGAVFIFFIALIFSKPINALVWYWLFSSFPLGGMIGLASWWDFMRRSKKLLLENSPQKSQ